MTTLLRFSQLAALAVALVATVIAAPVAQAQSVKGSGSWSVGFAEDTERLKINAHVDSQGVATGTAEFGSYVVNSNYTWRWVTVELPVVLLVISGNQALIGAGGYYF